MGALCLWVPWCGDRPRKRLNCATLDAVFSPVCCLLLGEQAHAALSPQPSCSISVPRSKVDHVHDILTGNATVIQLLVSFYRNVRGQNALRQILAGPVQEVLQDRTLSIRTDPVDIYKAWINQTESQSGHRRSDPPRKAWLGHRAIGIGMVMGILFFLPSKLPYEVSPEQALSHPEVQRRLDISIRNLLAITDRFVSAITSSVDKIP